MTAPLKARQAKPLDATNLLRLLVEGHEDNGGVYPPVDERLMLQWITAVLTGGYVVVIEKSGRIVGSIGLVPFQFPWSAEWLLNMEWFYVQKRFRRNSSADALLVAAHAFADDKGASIVGGVSSAKDAALKDRLMQIKGYCYMGGYFIRRLNNGQPIQRTQDQADYDE